MLAQRTLFDQFDAPRPPAQEPQSLPRPRAQQAVAAPVTARREIYTGTAARMLGLSAKTINKMCEEGTLRSWRFEPFGWWRIDYDAVMELRDKLRPDFT